VAASAAQQFVPITPCRVIDTRNAAAPLGGPSISGGTTRSIPVPQSACGLPAGIAASVLNVTAIPKTRFLGFLSVWQVGQTQPVVSTLNSQDGSLIATAAIVPAGTDGAINVYPTNDIDLVLDVNGYFVPGANTLQFYPVTPCRDWIRSIRAARSEGRRFPRRTSDRFRSHRARAASRLARARIP
jgi:hypothetical protein